MKHYTWKGLKGNLHFLIIFSTILSFLAFSCIPESDDLGVNIFPPNDTILIHTDTISNFETRLVRSRPWITSDNLFTATQNKTYYLGSKRDTLTGLAKAEIVAQLGLAQAGDFGDELSLDSLKLYLYIASVEGDTSQEMHIQIHDFLGDLDMDTAYYSDFDVTGLYNPEPLVDEFIKPKPQTTYEFEIKNQDFINRFIEASNPDDSIFIYNSRFQTSFPGFYITTETVTEGGALAKVHLANSLSALKFKYYHDSITPAQADTIPRSTYTMSFNYQYTQKVNIFHQDFSGTAVEAFLDNPDSEPHIGYVSGLSGISVQVSIPDPMTFITYEETDRVAITAARLLFYIVSDTSISGISKEDYPDMLMLDTKLSDGSYVSLYDYVINTSSEYYGKLTQTNEQSAFLEPYYYYSFNIGRHLQSVMAGEIENSDLIIYMNDPIANSKIIKFWSNYSGQDGGLRLELIYSKF